MLSEAYNAGVQTALAKCGFDSTLAGDTAGNMVTKAVSPPTMTRSVDSFAGLASKNRSSALSMKRAMPKSMTSSLSGLAAKVLK